MRRTTSRCAIRLQRKISCFNDQGFRSNKEKKTARKKIVSLSNKLLKRYRRSGEDCTCPVVNLSLFRAEESMYVKGLGRNQQGHVRKESAPGEARTVGRVS